MMNLQFVFTIFCVVQMLLTIMVWTRVVYLCVIMLNAWVDLFSYLFCFYYLMGFLLGNRSVMLQMDELC